MRQFLYLVIISAKKRKEKEGHSDMSGDKSKKKSKRSFSSGTSTRHTHRSSLFQHLTDMFTSHVAYLSMVCRGNWTEEYNVQFCEEWTNTSSSGSVGSGAWYVTFLFM